MQQLEVIESARKFAERKLGPHSHAALQSPVLQVHILARLREGQALEDAALAEIHAVGKENRLIADEFVAYFLSDLLRSARGSLGSGLRRFLDTGDLVQSVLGDVWAELAGIRFESRASFLSLLSMRIRWKAAGHARSERAQRRGGGRRLPVDPEELALPDPGPGPAERCDEHEEHERLIVTLVRLQPRDRDTLTRFLRGESTEEIAMGLGLSVESARKVLQRAIRKARTYANPGADGVRA